MDFDIVKRQIIYEYISLYGNDKPHGEWSLETCLSIFKYYYKTYKKVFGVDHPHLSNRTIREILENISVVQIPHSKDYFDLLPEDYTEIINAYFQQDFDDCNYSIAHFMSGNIRALRIYERLY